MLSKRIKDEAKWCINRLNSSKLKVTLMTGGRIYFDNEVVVHVNVVNRVTSLLKLLVKRTK